jgi:type I restriction enzyme M protein
MAIVLPQGVFNNLTMAYIREWILKKARILAVIGLHENTFKPHTGTKTSVLFLQKWHENILPIKNYPVFMATSEKSG